MNLIKIVISIFLFRIYKKHRKISKNEENINEKLKIFDSKFDKIENFVEREFIKINRTKSDSNIKLISIEQKIELFNSNLKEIIDSVEKLAKLSACLVEDIYIASLLIPTNEENSNEIISYRDQEFTRMELIKYKSEVLNSIWNPLSLVYPWNTSKNILMTTQEFTKKRLEIAKRSTPEPTRLKLFSPQQNIKEKQAKFAKLNLSGRNTGQSLISAATPLRGQRNTMTGTFFIEKRPNSRAFSRQTHKSFIS